MCRGTEASRGGLIPGHVARAGGPFEGVAGEAVTGEHDSPCLPWKLDFDPKQNGSH